MLYFYFYLVILKFAPTLLFVDFLLDVAVVLLYPNGCFKYYPMNYVSVYSFFRFISIIDLLMGLWICGVLVAVCPPVGMAGACSCALNY